MMALFFGVVALILFLGRRELGEVLCLLFCRCRRTYRRLDPCADEALASCRRRGPLSRLWERYCRLTGYGASKKPGLWRPWMRSIDQRRRP